MFAASDSGSFALTSASQKKLSQAQRNALIFNMPWLHYLLQNLVVDQIHQQHPVHPRSTHWQRRLDLLR